MNDNQISILLPTFNRPKLLARAIYSVLEQSYTNFSVCVQDNGSDDETYELMQEITKADSRVSYRRNRSNIGAIENFQTLVSSVTSPYFCLLSDDDFLMPEFLANGTMMLADNPKAKLFCGATATANLTSRLLHYRNQLWTDGFYYPSLENTQKIIAEHFTSTGTIFKSEIRTLFKGVHGLGQDNITNILLTGCFPFVCSSNICAIYTINEKRFWWHHFINIEMGKILLEGASDRRFVLENAPESTLLALLEYLEIAYTGIIEGKSIASIRSKTSKNSIITSKIKCRYSAYKYIKMLIMRRCPDVLLSLILNLKKKNPTFSTSQRYLSDEAKKYLYGDNPRGIREFAQSCKVINPATKWIDSQ